MRSPGRANAAKAAAMPCVSDTEDAQSSNISGIDATARDSGHSTADATNDLVPDSSKSVGPVLGANPHRSIRSALLSDQNNVITDAHLIVTAIDHQLIHCDRPDDRPTPTADQNFSPGRREPPRHTIGGIDGQLKGPAGVLR